MTSDLEARAAIERAAELLGVSLAEARRRAALSLMRELDPGWRHITTPDPRQLPIGFGES